MHARFVGWPVLAVVVVGCATTPAPTPEPKEFLVQADVQGAITDHRDALAECAAEQRRWDATVTGKLVMTFLIAPSGEPHDVAPVERPLSGSVFAVCVTRVLSAVRFPKHRTAGPKIIYPLQL